MIENTNRSNAYSHSQRSNILCDPGERSRWRNNVKGETFFDTALFAAPGTGVFGDAPSSIRCGLGIASVDVSVHKWFDPSERLRLQFRGDFYNFPNHPMFENPEERRGRGDFGTISTVLAGTGGRVSQLSSWLEF